MFVDGVGWLCRGFRKADGSPPTTCGDDEFGMDPGSEMYQDGQSMGGMILVPRMTTEMGYAMEKKKIKIATRVEKTRRMKEATRVRKTEDGGGGDEWDGEWEEEGWV